MLSPGLWVDILPSFIVAPADIALFKVNVTCSANTARYNDLIIREFDVTDEVYVDSLILSTVNTEILNLLLKVELIKLNNTIY